MASIFDQDPKTGLTGLETLLGNVTMPSLVNPQITNKQMIELKRNLYREFYSGVVSETNNKIKSLIEREKIAIEKKIDTFNKNYGELTFNNECACCNSNRELLNMFNIDAEKLRLDDINKLLDAKNITIDKFNEYHESLDKLDIYRTNVKLNLEITENNLKLDKLTEYKLQMYNSDKLSQVLQYD